MAEWSTLEYRIQRFMDALTMLEMEGEVWFTPGNDGDLGAVVLDGRFIDSIRTSDKGYNG